MRYRTSVWKWSGQVRCRGRPRRWATREPTVFQLLVRDRVYSGVSRIGLGCVLLAVEPRGFGRFRPEALLQRVPNHMKRRVLLPDGEDAPLGAACGTKLLLKLQNLVQHCAVAVYDDGKERSPGTLIVFTRGKLWTVMAKDPDVGAKLSATAESLDEALLSLDLLLGSEDAQWEKDQYSAGNRKGRGKRK